jgi:uncharacterized membrane protein YbaN (DUF454 family)
MRSHLGGDLSGLQAGRARRDVAAKALEAIAAIQLRPGGAPLDTETHFPYETMANPEPATDLRPAGQFPSEDGSGNWDIAGEAGVNSSALLRWLLLFTGLVFVSLAALGAVLPVLPTVPFLLVAAACFARSSARFYQWLLSNRLFGPLIRDWRETRTIPLRAKLSAIAAIALVGGSSVLFYVANPWAKLGVGVILIGLIGFLLRLPTRRR